MKLISSLILILFTLTAMADTRFSVDISIDKLLFQKPVKGVGKAGSLNFKTANISNNGIVLNLNNINNFFDSQIFVRPTFLGFTTQFGNYGFAIEENSVINQITQTELQNSKLILDDSQLSLSGELFSAINLNTNIKLKNFLLYCQGNGLMSVGNNAVVDPPPPIDLMKSCFSFMTLNGASTPLNPAAEVEYEGLSTTGKMFAHSLVRSFDLRPKSINADLANVKVVSNNEYFIDAQNLKLDCDKDEGLTELDFEKIKKTCANRFQLNPLKATLVDKKQNTSFSLDTKNIAVKDKMFYMGLNSVALSNTTSTTYVLNALLNCRKETESDLFVVTDVLRDCITYGRLSIAELKSDNKIDDRKDSSNKNLLINSDAGKLIIQTDVHFLGMNHPVVVYGRIALDEAKRKLTLTVTDTKLPFGITSVKLLMYFLKKDLISKDIQIQNNVITITI